jgi:hypothetical protein
VPSALDVTRTSASRASDVGYSDIGDSTMARSCTFVVDDATKGRHRDVTGCTAFQSQGRNR